MAYFVSHFQSMKKDDKSQVAHRIHLGQAYPALFQTPESSSSQRGRN